MQWHTWDLDTLFYSPLYEIISLLIEIPEGENDGNLHLTFLEEHISSDNFEVINGAKSPKYLRPKAKYNNMTTSVDDSLLETCPSEVTQCLLALVLLMQELLISSREETNVWLYRQKCWLRKKQELHCKLQLTINTLFSSSVVSDIFLELCHLVLSLKVLQQLYKNWVEETWHWTLLYRYH